MFLSKGFDLQKFWFFIQKRLHKLRDIFVIKDSSGKFTCFTKSLCNIFETLGIFQKKKKFW